MNTPTNNRVRVTRLQASEGNGAKASSQYERALHNSLEIRYIQSLKHGVIQDIRKHTPSGRVFYTHSSLVQ